MSFEFMLRALGKRLGWLILSVAFLSWFPAFFWNTMGRKSDSATHWIAGLLAYCLLTAALVAYGFWVGWFDRRPFRFVGLVLILTASITPICFALASMLVGLDVSWYYDLRWKPWAVLCGLGIGFLWADWQDQRWERKKMSAHLSET